MILDINDMYDRINLKINDLPENKIGHELSRMTASRQSLRFKWNLPRATSAGIERRPHVDIGEGKQMLESPSDVETAAYIARVSHDTSNRVFVIVLSERHCRRNTKCFTFYARSNYHFKKRYSPSFIHRDKITQIYKRIICFENK